MIFIPNDLLKYVFVKIAPSQNNIFINTMHDLCIDTVGLFQQVWLVKDDSYFYFIPISMVAI